LLEIIAFALNQSAIDEKLAVFSRVIKMRARASDMTTGGSDKTKLHGFSPCYQVALMLPRHDAGMWCVLALATCSASLSWNAPSGALGAPAVRGATARP